MRILRLLFFPALSLLSAFSFFFFLSLTRPYLSLLEKKNSTFLKKKKKKTGGAVVCLGPAGRNIAAGMTGGLAYFYDADGSLPDKVNGEIVTVQRVCSAAGAAALRKLIGDHVERTGSKLGSEILANWGESLGKFWQLVPPSEANTPEASPDADGASVAATAGVPAAA